LSCLSRLRFPPVSSHLFFFLLPRPPRSSLFPYTTLFRSSRRPCSGCRRRASMPIRLAAVRPVRAPCPVPVPRARAAASPRQRFRSEEHTSELQSRSDLVCRLLLEKKNDGPAVEDVLGPDY